MAVKKEPVQPEITIGTAGHIDHGKTALIEVLTGIHTEKHTEEKKRGITIRLGYADCTVRYCAKCKKYTTSKKCSCGGTTEYILKFSFVDAPGHETLMTTMLSGAAIMSGALLVIAANEQCPQPQTKEHLMALDILGVKNIIIAQNKIDLVNDAQAEENYNQIKEFVKGTVAENAPIIPVSANKNVNIDMLLKAMAETYTVPEKPKDEKFIMLVARSFDANKPGAKIDELNGGILGGIIKQGKLRKNDEVIVLPGIKSGEDFQKIKTKITSIFTGSKSVDEAGNGGTIAVATELDPSLAKSDYLSGTVLVRNEDDIKLYDTMDIELHLIERIVGTENNLEYSPIKINEPLLINAWTSKTIGTVSSIKGNSISCRLKIPVAIEKGEKIAVLRRIDNRWRLAGYGIITN
ncbi:MAG: translation initiation factor IF-2 subunit gamma [Candidatus Nanoarchaeia archaeon]|nr:translation initiation factor IF-2 subunit gamma [Candidatus Nanoarchaeia archaeon]